MASTFVVKPGFSTFGVEIASSTSSPIKLSSLGSPIARRERRLPPDVSAVTAGVSVAGASTPAAISSFLFVVVEAASAALFAGVAASKLGVSEVAAAVDVADAAVLVLLASLVEAAVEVTAGAAS